MVRGCGVGVVKVDCVLIKTVFFHIARWKNLNGKGKKWVVGYISRTLGRHCCCKFLKHCYSSASTEYVMLTWAMSHHLQKQKRQISWHAIVREVTGPAWVSYEQLKLRTFQNNIFRSQGEKEKKKTERTLKLDRPALPPRKERHSPTRSELPRWLLEYWGRFHAISPDCHNRETSEEVPFLKHCWALLRNLHYRRKIEMKMKMKH